MKCDEARERLIEALAGQLDEDREHELERHFEGCADCAEEASSLRGTWRAMGALEGAGLPEVPSDRMRIRFRAALGGYEASLERSWKNRLERGLGRLWPGIASPSPLAQVAAAAAILAIGLLVGWGTSGFLGSGREVAQLRDEMAAMNRTVTLALLDHQSASERLRGVSWSAGLEPDDGVLTALVEVAQRDANVNVRLAAVEALGAHLERPMVRSGLLQSLEERPAPHLQMAVTRLFAADEGGSRRELERLLESDLLDPAVRRLLTEDEAAENPRLDREG